VLIITSKVEQYQYEKKDEDFSELAKELGIDFLLTEKLNSTQTHEFIRKTVPDIAISVNWKTLIPHECMNLFPYGILNAHAGDLPRFKGNAVRNWALVSGEESMSLTIHEMSVDLDAGPILLKKRYPIRSDTNIQDLYRFVEEQVPLLFVKAVSGLESGSIVPKKQPTRPDISLRCYPRLPVDSEINWEDSAENIHRLVRASSEPFTGAYSYIEAEKITIWKAHVEVPQIKYLASCGQVVERRLKTGEVAVSTGEGFLIIEDAETETYGRIKPSQIITSLRTRLGMSVTDEIMKLKREIKNLKKEISSLTNRKQ